MSLLTTLLVLAIAAYGSAQEDEGQDLLSVLGTSQLNTLVQLLQTAGLEDALKGDGPFTVMAPSDEAFAKLDPTVLENLQSDIDALTQILTFHVIPTSVPSKDISNGLMIPTLLGSSLTFTVTDGAVMVNDAATVTQADIMAANGLVHVIDAVLMPPGDKEESSGIGKMLENKISTWDDMEEDGSGDTDEEGTLNMDLVDLALNEGLSTLVFLLQFAGLQDTLREPGPFTIFAPHDSAGFSHVDPHVMDKAMADHDFLVELMSYHVIPGKTLLSSDIVGNLTVATLEGGSIDLSEAEDGKLLLNGDRAKVLYSDMIASNGVLHIIDHLLVPANLMVAPGTILEMAAEKKLSTFLELVEEADLSDTLNMTGPYTVFAPTDDAFAALPEELLQQLKDDPSELKKVLLYHVVEGVVTPHNFQNDLLMPTLQGVALRLNIYPRRPGVVKVTVDGSYVLRRNVAASNGHLHLIERVLLPPKGNIADLLAQEEDLSIFTKALTTTNMMDFLINEDPLTIMAPVDAAFDALPEDALARLMEDEELLAKVLQEHIIPATLHEEGMSWSSVPSMGGSLVAFVKNASAATVVASPMTVTGLEGPEITATNGVIHKIKDILFS